MLDVLIARKTQRQPRLWQGSKPHGPFDWSAGLPPALYWTMMAMICVSVTATSLLSIAYGPSPVAGILNLAGLSLFVLSGTTRNPYATAPHSYGDDSLRIALPTTHHEGTVYVLPGPGLGPGSSGGFDAVWSPKLAAEHADADAQMMTLFAHMRGDRWGPAEPLERLRTTLAHYQARTRISVGQAERLAAWIYLDDDEDEDEDEDAGGGVAKKPGRGAIISDEERASLRRIECRRAPGVHLIGRDLMFALCHAEYLVFMAAGRLRPETAAKFGRLRLERRSGAGPGTDPGADTVGYGRPGLEGYRQAVEHVYAMFDLPVDRAAVVFDEATTPPSFSFALSGEPASIDEYAGQLWDLSCRHSESTFSALYFFTTVWAFEVGNVNGFHLFPLRARDREGDVVTQLMLWRQVWWAACVSQLVSLSPMLFGLFVAGFVPAA
ncbi:hypothetical protein NKR19_g2725 [Coniochaeta hoffmannii]|uniref:Uncharacterized protein n=1 Tax=Coniochaeta hoffmannii TaxID=91930 RepID=A0AA38SG52_9PEZI|nr:hypothetical protein NKR19_g2725 [Coniochaeta hoffmannii]